ncbi:MAG: radical SAM protein [Acidobacteriota bacterium]|nr:radical SAM protein [Acidobacteriota bacterium]
MHFNGTDYIVTEHGRQRIGSGINEIGQAVLDFVKTAPVACSFSRLMDSLLEEYDVDRAILEKDVRAFLLICIGTDALVEPGKQKLYGLDLSVTNKCNATCVYCPTPRIEAPKRLLEMDEVTKLIDELSAPEFEAELGRLTTIEIGGLTEPLMHRQAIDILREFKRRYPTPFVILYTNAVLLTPEHISALLGEELISSLVVSIDGVDQHEHFAAKGVPYATVEKNLEQFIRTRDELNSACRVMIHVLPYARYRALVQKQLNRDPLITPRSGGEFRDQTAEVVARWQPLLSDTDTIRDGAESFQLRGEYRLDSDTFAVPEEALNCPWPDYVAHSLSVTSNGDVVICCNDFQKESVLGNFLTTSLYDIVVGPRRRFIEKLTRNDRENLPTRCLQRKYCQPLSFGQNGDRHDLQR